MTTHINAPAPTELIRTSTFGIPVTTELNVWCVKRDGAIGDGTGNQWMTGSLVINASPALKLRRTGDAPYIQFENTTGATILGQLQGTTSAMVYDAKPVASTHSFRINAVEKFEIASTGVTAANLTVTTKATLGGNGELMRLVDTSTSGSDFHDIYVGFYGAGVSLVSPGVRTGLVGFSSSATLQLRNEVLNGGVLILGNGSGTVQIQTGASGDIDMVTGAGGNIIVNAAASVVLDAGGAERGRITGTQLLWGKSATSIGTVGVELGENGRVDSAAASGIVNLYLRHTVDADGAAYVQFAKADANIVSQITQDNTAPVGIAISNCATTAPSDYRLKNDLGPVVDALERVLTLQPKHLAWKATGEQFDGFLAHEVAAVVPDTVTGDKDAVYDTAEAELMGVAPGSIKPQQLNQTPLIPLLTAGLQELAARVAALEGAA